MTPTSDNPQLEIPTLLQTIGRETVTGHGIPTFNEVIDAETGEAIELIATSIGPCTARLPEALRGIAAFSYITGWRVRSEVLPLQWRQVDFDSGEIRLDPGTTKNNEARTFIMTSDLRSELERLRKATQELERADGKIIRWVFHREGEQIKTFYGSWRAACKAAGVPGRKQADTAYRLRSHLAHGAVTRVEAGTLELYVAIERVLRETLRRGIGVQEWRNRFRDDASIREAWPIDLPTECPTCKRPLPEAT